MRLKFSYQSPIKKSKLAATQDLYTSSQNIKNSTQQIDNEDHMSEISSLLEDGSTSQEFQKLNEQEIIKSKDVEESKIEKLITVEEKIVQKEHILKNDIQNDTQRASQQFIKNQKPIGYKKKADDLVDIWSKEEFGKWFSFLFDKKNTEFKKIGQSQG